MLKTLTPPLHALSVLVGIAGQVMAQTADEISPNNSKDYYEQLDARTVVAIPSN